MIHRTWMLVVLACAASCKSSDAPRARSSELGAARTDERAEGDPLVQAALEITDARLVAGSPGSSAEFTLTNRSSEPLRFEFLVEAYARDAAPLAYGRTAWVELELAAGASRPVRTTALPPGSESWRLIARRPAGR